MPITVPVYDVTVAESLPALSLWVTVDGKLLTDLVSDAAFTLLVRDPDDQTTLFVKTDGFTAQTGSGTEHNGVPNLIVNWATAGELDQLTGDRSHKALLTVGRPSDSRQRYYNFIIRAQPRTGG